MAREQCVIVGVIRTVRVVRGDAAPFSGKVGLRCMSGRLTTEREPSVRGCSGSVICAMRSGHVSWGREGHEHITGSISSKKVVRTVES